MKREKLSIMVERGILLGIAEALNYFVLLIMPYGGAITLAPLPIIMFSIRRGVKQGFFLGILYGILYFILTNKFSLHPLSIVLDYIVPGAALSLVAIDKYNLGFLLATIVCFASHFLSGILVFSSYTGDSNSIIYSFTYNFTYVIPEMLIVFTLVILLKKFIPIFFRK